MATVYSPLDALNFAKRFIMNMPLDDATIKIRILQAASDEIHMYASWRWSVGQFGVVSIANDTEDYSISDPGDVLFGLAGELRFGERERVDPVVFVTSLPATPTSPLRLVGTPRKVELTTATNLRFSPVPAGFETTDLPKFIGWYKKKNIQIQESGAETTLVKNDDTPGALRFGDEWFWVYEQIVLRYAFQFSADPRFQGQFEVVERLKAQMFEKEKPLLYDLGVRDSG